MEKFTKPSKTYESRVYAMRFDMEGDSSVVGYAAVFNKWSRDLGGFKEIIQPNAFKDVLKDDVVALFNHRIDNILGRTSSGTVEIWQDDEGLGYRVKLPNTQLGKDIRELIERGDITESSLGFSLDPGDSSWNFSGDIPTHTIKRVSRLWDVSPVTWAAYPDTSVSAEVMQRLLRESDEQERMMAQQARARAEQEYRERKLYILSITT